MRKVLAFLAMAILAMPAMADEKKDIVDTAVGAENFNCPFA